MNCGSNWRVNPAQVGPILFFHEQGREKWPEDYEKWVGGKCWGLGMGVCFRINTCLDGLYYIPSYTVEGRS